MKTLFLFFITLTICGCGLVQSGTESIEKWQSAIAGRNARLSFKQQGDTVRIVRSYAEFVGKLTKRDTTYTLRTGETLTVLWVSPDSAVLINTIQPDTAQVIR